MTEIGDSSSRQIQGQYADLQTHDWLENPAQLLTLVNGPIYKPDVTLGRSGRGVFWSDGAGAFGLVNTILPPNGPSASLGNGPSSDGFYSAGSFHDSGITVCMADCSIRFISNSIDTGDLTSPVPLFQINNARQPSVYGVWGALGTANSGEQIRE